MDSGTGGYIDERVGLRGNSVLLERDPSHVKIRKGHCYTMLVLVGILIMAFICVLLLFVVRPSVFTAGLPVCAIGSTARPNSSMVWMANRHRLLAQPEVQSIKNGFLFFVGEVVLPTGDADSTVPFRQDSDFLYVSGADNLPSSFLYIDPASANVIFFLGDIDPVWDGKVYSMEHWSKLLMVNETRLASELPAFLGQLDNSTIMYTLPDYQVTGLGWTGAVNKAVLQAAVSRSRLIKGPEEVELLRFASEVTSAAHSQLMLKASKTRSFQGTEWALQALFYESTLACSCEITGYEPIIASGYSSAVLHYIANDRSYGAGELVLVDAAGSTQQYTSDVTRTWPSNGRFTDKQAAIYNAVLNAQTAAASLCRNGAMFSDLSNAARESISSDLFKLGLVLTPPPFPSGLFTLFMPHGLGHSVGLDVHDEGGSISTLLTGMVFTIEPGLYFNKALFTPAAFAKYPQLNATLIQEQYLDTNFGGVRIEDVYVVRDGDCEALSSAPKTIAAIERLMGYK